MGTCPSDSDLDRFHAHEMDETEAEGVRRHLAECADCARRDAEIVGRHDARIRQLGDLGELGDTASAERGTATQPANGPQAVDVKQPVVPNFGIEGYEIARELHRGGQGVVYQAIQRSTKRKVAIKVLLEGPYASPSAKRRFEREIELVASLKHTNIISVFHSGLTPDGRQFCVMDYVRGKPIHQYCRDQKPTLEEVLKLFAKVCDAVNYAHQKGVIHRDLKPSNILVDVEGAPKVLDFGLAKLVGGPEQTLVSVSGQVVGTLPYMSPEQTRGNPEEIDIRTDVYALGVVLYEMLTGHYPYPVVGQIAEVFKHITETPPTPPSRSWKTDSGVTKRTTRRLRAGECPIDDEVQTIVLRTLAKERDRRYQSAGELANDIGHYLNNEPIEAKRDSGWYVLRKTLGRYRARAALAAAFLVLLVSGSVALSVMYGRAEQSRREAVEAQADAEKNLQLADQRYEEIVRLADLKRLADARAAADSLWPAHPEKIAAMETWLTTKAAPLRDNLPKHETTLAALRETALEYDADQQRHDRETHPKAAQLAEQEQRLAELRKELDGARAEESDDVEAKAKKTEKLEKTVAETEQSISELREAVKERRSWKFSDDQTQWQHDTLAGLVADLKAFVDPDPKKGTLASVQERLTFAGGLEEQSITGPEAAAKWAEAIADIARLEVYGGLQIKPQLGLLPLRRDPRSGLWEFRHIQTGTTPELNPDDEAVNPWILTGDTGLVFVLIPAGTFWMGAQKEDSNGHNYDPQAAAIESPVHEVTLAAFFISKYEMTQGQWQRFTGANPSTYLPSFSWKGEPPAESPIHQNQPWNPVEQVSWTDCRDVLGRLGLVLPTEAQWEHAARAGTDTTWWTGNEKESIGVEGAGNLADGWTKSKGGPAAWRYEDWLEDGWVVHAPVGSFSANGFGLHDVIGNVWEWCRDGFGGYELDVEPGDGLRKVTGARVRVDRGGSFDDAAAGARSAYRGGTAPEVRFYDLGVRPARVITE